jgi:molybdopterin-guanine dinucleotide biosynthesis protein A
MASKMTGIILAGGKNTRIGMDKAFLRIGDKVIIEEILAKLSTIFPKIIVVTNSPNSYCYLGVEVVRDILPDKGALGGIYSGLVASEAHYNFVLACDMPFISLNLIEYMRKNAEGYNVVIPKPNNYFQPLHAIYSKDCIQPIKEQLHRNDLQVFGFFNRVEVKCISAEEVKAFDPRGIAFFNINTKNDTEEAERIALDLSLKKPQGFLQ